MKSRALFLVAILAIASILIVSFLWIRANAIRAQIAHQLEISPVMKVYDYGSQACTSIYFVIGHGDELVYSLHRFYDELDQSVHSFTDIVEPGSSATYDLADIAEIPDYYIGYVIVETDHRVTYALDACANIPPTASFRAVPTVGAAPLAVRFADTYTWSVPSMIWSLGDGTVITNTSVVTHTYADSGRYLSQLTLSNASGSARAQQFIIAGGWDKTLNAGEAFTKTLSAEGIYPTIDPTTNKTGFVHVNPSGGWRSIVATTTVTVTRHGFTPSIVEVTEGDTVRWHNVDTVACGVVGWGPEWHFFLSVFVHND